MPRARKTTTEDGPQEPKSVAKATASRSRKTPAPAQPALAPALTTDEIARRAYELYERSGYQQGQDLDHWLIAERELQNSQP